MENKENPKILFKGVWGASATNLINRLSHGDEEIENLVETLLNIEQELHPNQIIAEVIHLPSDGIGNITRRKCSRQFEIPFLTLENSENVIHLSDILISVVDGKIVLRTVNDKREILPKLSNAHYYKVNNLPCLLYTSPSPRDATLSRMPSSA